MAASLAQIGEFSFILAGLGVALGLLPAVGMSLVLAGALISIALNPLLFAAIAPLQTWLLKRSKLARELEGATTLCRAAREHRTQISGRASGAGGLRPGGPGHCQGTGCSQHSLHRGRTKPGAGGIAAPRGHCRRVGQRSRAGSADPGPYRQRRHPGHCHPDTLHVRQMVEIARR